VVDFLDLPDEEDFLALPCNEVERNFLKERKSIDELFNPFVTEKESVDREFMRAGIRSQ